MMDLKNLFTDEDAVSPVIGVILMVAITVILAAVIGAFVLNIGGNQEAAPQAQFDFEYSTNNNPNDQVVVSHGGGGPVDPSQLSIDFDGGDCEVNDGGSNSLSAGDAIVDNDGDPTTSNACNHKQNPGDSLSITWTSSSGENSQIVAESTVP